MNFILFIAGALMMLSPISYLFKVSKKKVRPSILSWYGWTVLMGISIISQIVEEGWSSGLINICVSTFSCIAIATCAQFVFKSFSVNKKDIIYVFAGAICILIYFLSHNQWITTSTAIAADLMLAIPTLKAAYQNPQDERSFTWPLALSSWVLTLSVVLVNGSLINLLWPIYLTLFNGTMTSFTFLRSQKKKKLMVNLLAV